MLTFLRKPGALVAEDSSEDKLAGIENVGLANAVVLDKDVDMLARNEAP